VNGLTALGNRVLGTIQRRRTFGVRVTLAAVLACLALNILVTGTPRLTDAVRLPVTLGTALALFGVSYLAVCAAELLLSLVLGAPLTAPGPGSGPGSGPPRRRR
jgi:hypothetical protein